MQDVFTILESNGLISEEYIPKIIDLSRKQTFKLYEQVYRTVFDEQTKSSATERPNDPFTFYVGASLRGDNCWMPPCRFQKLDFLGHYAALYTNEVTVPLNLRAPDKLDTIGDARTFLSLSVTTLFKLRPLIDQHIVKPVVMRTAHCIHTIKWADETSGLVHDVAQDAARDAVKDFTVHYQTADKRLADAYCCKQVRIYPVEFRRSLNLAPFIKGPVDCVSVRTGGC